MYGLGYLVLAGLCVGAWYFHYRPLEKDAHERRLAKIRKKIRRLEKKKQSAGKGQDS